MRINSSSLQKVPSKSSTSVDSNSSNKAASICGTAGMYARRLPDGDSRMKPSDDSAALSAAWRCIETYAGKCVASESARQRNFESSPAALTNGNTVPGTKSVQVN